MASHRDFARTLRGPLVPILAAFREDESLDIDSTCRWADRLIAGGCRQFWTTHGTTHMMALSDREIEDLTRALAAVMDGRAVLIASVPIHASTREAIRFVEFAASCRVPVVKLQVDWSFTFSDDMLFSHYRRIAEVSPLPLFAYTLGPSGIRTDLLKRIMELPPFIGMKNDTDDFYGQERYLSAVRECGRLDDFLVVTGGGLSSVALTYDLGVRVYGDMTPWYSPALSLRLHEALAAGRRALLTRFLAEIEEPLFFRHWPAIGAGGHWGWGHAIACHLGLFASPRMRFPLVNLADEHIAAARGFLDMVSAWNPSLEDPHSCP